MSVKLLHETVTIGEAGIFYDFVSAEVTKSWTAITLFPELKDEWIHDEDDTEALGNVYYRDMKRAVVHQYHALAHHTNEMYNRYLPSFQEAMVLGLDRLKHPNYKAGLVTIPRRRKLPGPKGEDYWVDCGIHAVTRQSRGGDEPHGDYEGLEPYIPLMFDERTISFSLVLCLACPPNGGGIKVWPGRHLAGADLDFDPKTAPEPEHFLYKPGSLAIFDSFRFHQVQRAELTAEHPYRMVGIIHALFCEYPIPHWEYWF